MILTVNSTNLSGLIALNGLEVNTEFEYGDIITTMSGTEYRSDLRYRDIIKVSLIPLTAVQVNTVSTALKGLTLSVEYKDAGMAAERISNMYLVNRLQFSRAGKGADGLDYYSCPTLELREIACREA